MPDWPARIAPSAIAGDGLIAVKSIAAGDVIFGLPSPLYGALDNPCLPERCSNCFRGINDDVLKGQMQTLKLQVCAGCHTLRYCSKRCQSASWKAGHKHECKVLAKVPRPDGSTLPNAARLCVSILSRDHHAGTASLRSLHSHSSEITRGAGERLENLKILSTGLSEYIRFPSSSSGSSTRAASYDQVFDTLSAIHTNALTLNTSIFDPIGICIDPTISKINHSCDPNSFVVFDGPRVQIRALTPINPGDDVTICYIDVTQPYRPRQNELIEQYYFSCQCSKCKLGLETPLDKFAQDPSRLSENVQNAIRNSLRILNTTVETNHKPDDAYTISLALSALQGIGFTTVQRAKHPDISTQPSEILELLSNAISSFCASTIWPLHRQPLPSLLQEKFLACLSAGNWLQALRTGLIIYYRIHPTLYLQPWHPLRVVHAFALIKLGMYITSETSLRGRLVQPLEPGGKALPHEANLGILVVGLLAEVCEGTRLSHGLGSSFGNLVAEKASEVIQASGTHARDVFLGNADSEMGQAVEKQMWLFREWVSD